MAVPPHDFLSCPIAARFIETADDARSYYAHKLVGLHDVTVKGAALVIRFNHEEIHHFTESTPCKWCPGCTRVSRRGRSGEQRCFNRSRARQMDAILDTLRKAAVVHEAKMAGARMVYGPADVNAQRLAVVIGEETGVWFVRTAFSVSAKEYLKALRSGKAAPWPPK